MAAVQALTSRVPVTTRFRGPQHVRGYSAYGSPRGAAVPAAGPAPVTGDPSPSTAAGAVRTFVACRPGRRAGRGSAGRDTGANGDEVLR